MKSSWPRVLVLPLLMLAVPACSKDTNQSAGSGSASPQVREAPTVAAPPPAGPDVGSEPTVEQYGTILNIAGRQRMLTQRMAKEVFLAAADVDAATNRKNAAESMALFKKSLAGLRNGDDSMKLPPGHFGKINARLDHLSNNFKTLEGLVDKTTRGDKLSKEELTSVRDQVDSLVEQEETIMTILSGSAGAALTKSGSKVATDANLAIDVAGRQRMFSQKMAKDCALVHLKIDTDRHRSELKKTSSLFDKVEQGLRKGDKDIGIKGTSEADIVSQLDVVDGLWKGYGEVVRKHADSKVDMTKQELEIVAKLNLPLLTEANKTVEILQKSVSGEKSASASPPVAAAKK